MTWHASRIGDVGKSYADGLAVGIGMPTAAVRAVGVEMTTSKSRQRKAHRAHIYADGLDMPTATVGIYHDMPTA